MAPTATTTATTATTNVFLLVGAVVACLLLCLPTTTTALPMPGVVAQALLAARSQPHHLDRRDVSETTCAQPTNLQAMFQQINQNVDGVTMLQRAKNGKALSAPADAKFKVISGDENESKTCPSTLTRLPGSPLAHRSLCPYYHDVLQLPRGYYPPTLLWAQCKCQRCVENTGYGCEAIMTQVAVLKPTGCFQGLQRYEEHLIEVKTGCTCAVAATGAAESVNVASATTTTSAPAAVNWAI